MKRIFIGGMGRSGTSILLHALYCHGCVYAVPIETKFLVEEDGFDDLITALTTRFSAAGAPVAVRRFRDLMWRQVPGLVDSKFRKQEHLPSAVFANYDDAVDAFMSEIYGDGVYFPCREILLDATRHFIAALFDTQTREAEKSVWVEKTPANYWRLPFLRELWPDCYFVHAVRDPRAIFLSLLERHWLPPDLVHAMGMFKSQMIALLERRRSYIEYARYTEVRLEDLVAHPRRTLDELAEAVGLAPFAPPAAAAVVETMNVYYSSKRIPDFCLTAQGREMVNEQLLPAVVELGYPRCWQSNQPKV
jgi:hypothetical protein